MPVPTSTAVNFYQQIQDSVASSSASLLRSTIKQILPTTWPYLAIFVVFVIASKLMEGRIGSLIYNFIYFGILAIIVAVKGLDVFFSSYFDIIYALLYLISYFLTGLILKKIRGRNY